MTRRCASPAFTPSSGSITVITGPTGSGKSTILRGIAGLLSHVDGGEISGTVRVAGTDRATTPPRDTARLIGVVLQNPRAAFASTRVRDEISLALELRGMASATAKARVLEVAERIGVSALLDRNVSTLSAGEATLVAIAAAVVEHPALLLVDEPLADLDTAARGHVIAVLNALARDAGVCVIVAEHRAAAARTGCRLVVDHRRRRPGAGCCAVRAFAPCRCASRRRHSRRSTCPS